MFSIVAVLFFSIPTNSVRGFSFIHTLSCLASIKWLRNRNTMWGLPLPFSFRYCLKTKEMWHLFHRKHCQFFFISLKRNLFILWISKHICKEHCNQLPHTHDLWLFVVVALMTQPDESTNKGWGLISLIYWTNICWISVIYQALL